MSRQDPGHFARVKQILGEIHELGDADRREYLDRVCQDDLQLRAEIESLLSHEQGPSLARPAPADAGETVFFTPVVEPGPLHATELGAVLAGRYRIDAFLAAGGMGQVYRGHDLELDVPIALKTIRPEIASHPASLRLFKQEVLLARSITHSNVCRIFDLRRDDPTGVVFLTMEFLPGETLMSRIKKGGRFVADDSLPLARQMADALDAAHRAGIIHRDFKSPNVMLVPSNGCDEQNVERAVITDFGLAITLEVDDDEAAADEDVQEPRSDVPSEVSGPDDRTVELRGPCIPSGRSRPVVGTPAYMAPEQVAGARVGPAADLYAFGVVLFEMSTGQLPFQEATPMDTARAHRTSPPPRPGTLASVDESWEKAILRLLSKDPDDRYATADEAVLALEGRENGTATVPHALAPERDVFVGRAEELQHLAELLEPDRNDSVQASRNSATSRLVTVLGLGGTGKSRLVQKYGWDSLLRWPGGVWFCDLSEAKTDRGIALAVAAALKISLGRGDPVVQLGHVIANRGGTLFILDNFEQVVDFAEATLGRWFERATEASFLVTSRERLRLREETTFELEPLDPATRGVELFEARAWGHRPGFLVDPSNQKLIEGIVEKLDGLPLAIELAASRLRNMDPDQLRAGLEDRFRLLVGKKRGRHATLEATLDWSWDLLEPWEQSAIAQASVFEGGFTLDAAEAVIDLSPYEEEPFVLDVIQSLVDKSWVRAKAEEGAPRFEMYVTVQEYASAKLHEQGSDVAEKDRHARFFAKAGKSDEATPNQGGVAAEMIALRRELENLLSACRWSIEQQNGTISAALYAALCPVLVTSMLDTAIEVGTDVLEVVGEPRERAGVLGLLSKAKTRANRWDEASAHCATALSIYRELGDRRGTGYTQQQIGWNQYRRGLPAEARVSSEAALDILREVGDRDVEGGALMTLGALCIDINAFEEADKHLAEALTLKRAVGNRAGQATVLSYLGDLRYRQSRVSDAIQYMESAASIQREFGDLWGEGEMVANVGALCLVLDRQDEAREHLETALVILRRVGGQLGVADVLGNFGWLDEAQGRLGAARRHYEASLAIYKETDHKRKQAIVLGHLAKLELKEGHLEQARNRAEAALAVSRDANIPLLEGQSLVLLATVTDQEKGPTDDVLRMFREGIVVLREVGKPDALGEALCQLGTAEVARTRSSPAHDALAEAESIAASLKEPPPEFTRAIEELKLGIDKLRQEPPNTGSS